MREFILLALNCRTSPDFSLDNLVKAGRLDLVCRTISNVLFLSNSIRRDSVIHVVMNGPKFPPKIISFYGESLRGLEPDERSIAGAIKLALKAGLNLCLGEIKNVSWGINIAKISFEKFVKEKSEHRQLIYLHKEGSDLREFKFEDDLLFVLGDYVGLPRKTEKLLDRFGAKRISLGPKMLFASHCSILVHNELDRRTNERIINS
jgi:tRNA (pseudouridine54-N1)-methyltransferase